MAALALGISLLSILLAATIPAKPQPLLTAWHEALSALTAVGAFAAGLAAAGQFFRRAYRDGTLTAFANWIDRIGSGRRRPRRPR